MPHKKAEEIAPISPEALKALMSDIWRAYPARDFPHQYPPARRAVAEQLVRGATPQQLLESAVEYARYVKLDRTEPKYIKSLHLFYADERWKHFVVTRVNGLTREEWARSGRDLTEFDAAASPKREAAEAV